MGVALQIIGVLFIIAALVFGIIAIINKSSATLTVVRLVIGGSLIRVGRKIN